MARGPRVCLAWLLQVASLTASGAAPAVVTATETAMRLAFQVAFCHNDLLSGNILDVVSEDRVQIIDYEYGACCLCG
jgi:hypothetical protein